MTLSLFAALFTFAAIAAWTPGPNNTILMASGLNHGFRRTIPMIFGVAIGFPFMIGMVGLGLGRVFEIFPRLYDIMKLAGAAYMLWLAWKIATSRPAEAGEKAGEPLSFMQGALFQWVNPKAWFIAITVLSAYTLPHAYLTGVVIVVATFMFMGITSASTWTMFGSALRHVMNDPRYYRMINFALAGALVLSLVPMLRH
jgi:threonine/homoserine/homoserine lactone efflux protein